MTGTMDEFDMLMYELVHEEGPRLLEENRRFRDKVPPRSEASARAVIAALGAGTAAKRALGLAGQGKLLTLAAAVTLTAAITGGALIASPTVRQHAGRAVSAVVETVTAQRAASRAPGDYIIPSPGEEFTVQESVDTDTLAYVWFAAGDRAALVEIASKLPEGTAIPEDAEPMPIGGTVGLCYEIDAAQYMIWQDGGVTILISLKNEDRQALLDYAERFAAANEIG